MNALIDREIVCPHCLLVQDNQVIPVDNDIVCEDCDKKFIAAMLITKVGE